ncbi:hypothetical protein RI367_008453 [Sorochytrium milnesiophthora]
MQLLNPVHAFIAFIIATVLTSVLLCIKVDSGSIGSFSYLAALTPNLVFSVFSTCLSDDHALHATYVVALVLLGFAADDVIGAGWMAIPLLACVLIKGKSGIGSVHGITIVDLLVTLQCFALLGNAAGSNWQLASVPWSLVLVPTYIAVLYMCRKVYSHTARQLRMAALAVFAVFVALPAASLGMVLYKLDQPPGSSLALCCIPLWLTAVIAAPLLATSHAAVAVIFPHQQPPTPPVLTVQVPPLGKYDGPAASPFNQPAYKFIPAALALTPPLPVVTIERGPGQSPVSVIGWVSPAASNWPSPVVSPFTP